VYIIKLAQNRYCIGTTDNPHLILDQYLPRYENQQQAITITFIPNCNECDKDRYMEEYGINKQLNTCIRCGKVGHKVSDGLCKSSPKL
jgi:hypothetical protein